MLGWSANTSAVARDLGKAGLCKCGLIQGLVAGTKVASNLGWCDVAALRAGDKVLTFGAAMQRVVAIQRVLLWADLGGLVPLSEWPLTVPEGALGNRCDLVLLPDQGVLVERGGPCDIRHDPCALVPAQALEGLRGITAKAPPKKLEVITLMFETDMIIYAEGGCLVHCPAGTASRVPDDGKGTCGSAYRIRYARGKPSGEDPLWI